MTAARGTVLVLASVAAAAAGIAALGAIARWRARAYSDSTVTETLRNAQEVLNDCYAKIRELEDYVPTLGTLARRTGSRRSTRTRARKLSPRTT